MRIKVLGFYLIYLLHIQVYSYILWEIWNWLLPGGAIVKTDLR